MGQNNPKTLTQTWAEANKDRFFFFEFIFSLSFLVLTMMSFSSFTQFIERRQGFQFVDPLLIKFSAYDLTWPIFSLIYGAILLGIGILVYRPYRLILLFKAYALMVLIRMVMMYLLPLDPPAGMILLQDPFVSLFVTGKTLTRDLFFSGHTATMFLLFLAVPIKYKKVFFTIASLVATGVLWQKVHYTVDVVVAPFVSFVAYYWASHYLSLNLFLNSSLGKKASEER